MVSIGDKIKYSDQYNVFEGVVRDIHAVNDGRVFIVETSDEVIKIFDSDSDSDFNIEVIEDPKPDDGRISEEDFEKAVKTILDPSTFEKMEESSRTLVTVTGGMICELLRRELFDKG